MAAIEIGLGQGQARLGRRQAAFGFFDLDRVKRQGLIHLVHPVGGGVKPFFGSFNPGAGADLVSDKQLAQPFELGSGQLLIALEGFQPIPVDGKLLCEPGDDVPELLNRGLGFRQRRLIVGIIDLKKRLVRGDGFAHVQPRVNGHNPAGYLGGDHHFLLRPGFAVSGD